MGLAVGIVGLPNVGKSTTFNALTKASNAQAASVEFCRLRQNYARCRLQSFWQKNRRFFARSFISAPAAQ